MTGGVELLSLVVVAVGMTRVGGWPHGAPSSACDSLRPGHNGQTPQNSQSPYRIDVSSAQYTPGEQITVSLIALGSEKFIGFLLETRLIDESRQLGGYIGSFSPVDGTQHIRGCGPATLTHVNSNSQSFTNLTVTWTAPTENEGSFVARATFVKNFNTFWTDIISQLIQPSPSVDTDQLLGGRENHTAFTTVSRTTTTTYMPATTAESSKAPEVSTLSQRQISSDLNFSTGSLTLCQNFSLPIKKDVECGRSKGCFVSCDSFVCDYVVSWVSTADSVEFQISAATMGAGDQWVAIGFSEDIEMGDDSVVECVSDGGIVSVYQAYNYVYYNTRRPQPSVGLSHAEGCFRDGFFWCKFTRRKRITEDNMLKKFDLNKEWVVMFARGEASQGELQMHSLSPRYGPWTSGVRVDFAQPAVFGKGTGSQLLVRLHGCLMVVAWVVAASAGLVAARYYRDEWTTLRPFQQALWFLVHRGCLVTTSVLVMIGFFVIYEEANRGFGPISNGYATGRLFESIHPSLGMATFCLTFVNPIMAIFRPKPDHTHRPVFNWAHRCVGVFTYVLALFTLTFGLGMQKAGVSDMGLYVMAGFGLYQCAVAVCLEISHCISPQLVNDRSGSTTEHESLIYAAEKKIAAEGPMLWNWKTTFFVGNCVILVTVGVFLVILISTDLSRRTI